MPRLARGRSFRGVVPSVDSASAPTWPQPHPRDPLHPRRLFRVGLAALIPGLAHAHALKPALAQAGRDAEFSLVDGLRVPLLAALLAARRGPQTLLAVTATSRESEAVEAAVRCYLP